MKFLMNGCLLLATADGSTVEIIEEIGAENMVISILNKLYKFILGHENLSCPPEGSGHVTYQLPPSWVCDEQPLCVDIVCFDSFTHTTLKCIHSSSSHTRLTTLSANNIRISEVQLS